MLHRLLATGTLSLALITPAYLGANARTPAPAAPNPEDAGPVTEQGAKPKGEHEKHGRDGKWTTVEGERSTKTFRVGEAGSLRVSNIAGDILVTGVAGSDIQVDAITRAKGRTETEAREQLSYVQVTMRQDGSRVDIETSHSRGSRAWVDYTINVPVGTVLDLRSVSGDLRLKNVQGGVRAETVSGDLVGNALGRVSHLKSVSGDVVIEGITADGDINLGSVSGDVVVKGLKARGAEVGTVSGDAVLNSCTCGNARLQSVSGNLQYVGKLDRQGRYELKSHSGDIKLATTDPFTLDANTFSGTVTSDLQLVVQSESSKESHAPGKWMRGSVGGGGASVEIKTFSGDVRLTSVP